MRRKRILYGITKGNWGGAQRYVFDLATHLPQDKYEISVMAGEGKILRERLHNEGIRLVAIPELVRDMNLFKEFRAFFAVLRIIQTEKPDVLHLNSPKMSGIGALAGRIAGVPKIVITVHGWSFREDRQIHERIAIWIFSWITTLLSHQTITITGRDLLTGRAMPFCRSKVSLIHNGVDPKSYLLLPPSDARKKLKEIIALRYPGESLESLANTIWLGANGELTKNKDYPTMIQAVAGLGVPTVIISAGKDEKKLNSLIDKLGARNRVFLAGFVPDARSMTSAFTVFLMSSIKEGLPYVIFEAGLAGLPVVATEVGGIPDIIENGKNGILVLPRDPEALKAKIIELIQNSERRNILGNLLRRDVLQKFTIQDMVEKTLHVYHK